METDLREMADGEKRQDWETEREVEPLIFTRQNGFLLSSLCELPHGEVRTKASHASRAEVSCCPHISEKMGREKREEMPWGFGEGREAICSAIFRKTFLQGYSYVRNVSWGLCATNNIEEMETQNSF